MVPDVVVVGAGYAGVAAVRQFERASTDVNLKWVSAAAHHQVKHEIHRIIRSPELAEGLAIPVESIAEDCTFQQARVVSIDPSARKLVTSSDERISYDYLLLTVGARTAFYGIPGLREHAHVLERISDAEDIHAAIAGADRPEVVIGGAGLSGVQSAGEVRALAPDARITLVEALDSLLPRTDSSLQRTVGSALGDRSIVVKTGSPIVEVTPDVVILEGDEEIGYDHLIWTGGIAGREVDHDGTLREERQRFAVDRTLRTSDDRIFACGDAAIIEQPNGIAPASAQAAWQSGPVAAENVTAAIDGEPLSPWTFEDKGTLVSIGDDAFAHDVNGIPVTPFGGVPAVTLKKLVAVRWIGGISSYRQGLSLWRSL